DKTNYAKNWNPLRLRVNKSPNPVKICVDTWNLIYSPVTSDMITQGLDSGGMTGLEKAIELMPKDARIHHQLSVVYKKAGLYSKAKKEAKIYEKLKKGKTHH
ncbi:MAG: hypothetical protein HOI47_19640, partial [Candidatus Scalindua sp.]|nr:hypothetical protein [Candidatus Scalindua sp.]